MLDQAAGHQGACPPVLSFWLNMNGAAGWFLRTDAGTVCKLLDPTEHAAYQQIGQDPGLMDVAPTLRGLREIDGKRYLELEDLLAGVSSEGSVMIDLKLGFTSFRADESGVHEPKERYYTKAHACETLRSQLSVCDHTSRQISKARYLSLLDRASSTALNGFRLEGARVGMELLKPPADAKSLEMLGSVLKRVRPVLLAAAADRIKMLRAKLTNSAIFARHSLYGSSLLMVFDQSANAEDLRMKIIDWRLLTEREFVCEHLVASQELPLPPESLEDGYLTALDSLVVFLESCLGS